MASDETVFLGIGCAWVLAVLFINIALIAAIALAVKWVIS